MKIRKYFKKMYKEEFDDPNEAFQGVSRKVCK